MRTIITDYLNNKISRRGFMKNMLASGYTLASANSVIKSLDSLREEDFLSESEYKTFMGTGGLTLLKFSWPE